MDSNEFKAFIENSGVSPLEQDKVSLHRPVNMSKRNASRHATGNNNDFTLPVNLSKMSFRHEAGLWLNYEINRNQKKLLKKSWGNVKDKIDLHGMTVDSALETIRRFIGRNITAKSKLICIIHGKGTGSLREATHSFLKGNPHVLAFTDSPSEGYLLAIVKANTPS